jgi:hypothetical protein
MTAFRVVALAALLLPLSGCAGREEAPASAFEATHWDSRAHDAGFEEVFRVDKVHGDAVSTSQVRVLVDGAPVEARWEGDADGVLSPQDRFAFVADSFDRPRLVEARLGDVVLWRAEYRGGTGTPV